MESALVRADPGSRTLRAAALVVGTLGLVAVGVLAVMVTPGPGDDPIAVESEASFVDPAQLVPGTAALLERAAAEMAGALGVARTGTAVTTIATFAGTTVVEPGAAAAPLATLLDSGLAIVTMKSLGGHEPGDPVDVRLASGRTLEGEVLATLGVAAVVAIESLLGGERAHRVTEVPADDSIVTLMLATPVDVRLGELDTTDAPEGTAVVDAAGRLIGLCTQGPDGTTNLIPASEVAADVSTTSTVVATSSAVSTTTLVATSTSVAASTTTTTTSTSTTSTTAPSSTSSTTSTTVPAAPGR